MLGVRASHTGAYILLLIKGAPSEIWMVRPPAVQGACPRPAGGALLVAAAPCTAQRGASHADQASLACFMHGRPSHNNIPAIVCTCIMGSMDTVELISVHAFVGL